MHRIYINDRLLVFKDVYKEINSTDENLLILSEAGFTLQQVLDEMSKEKTPGIIYLCASPDQAWSRFASNYTIVEAAGGFVRNAKNEFLVIYRKKRWDLPKGKLDYDETPELAAYREVSEECGLKFIEIEKPIIKTFHTYTEKEKSILKKTHWFSMIALKDEKLTPQAEENIEEAEWMSKEKIYEMILPNTYASIRKVIEAYFENK